MCHAKITDWQWGNVSLCVLISKLCFDILPRSVRIDTQPEWFAGECSGWQINNFPLMFVVWQLSSEYCAVDIDFIYVKLLSIIQCLCFMIYKSQPLSGFTIQCTWYLFPLTLEHHFTLLIIIITCMNIHHLLFKSPGTWGYSWLVISHKYHKNRWMRQLSWSR